MEGLNELKKYRSSSELNQYLSNNIDFIFQEFFNSRNDFLIEERDEIESYIFTNIEVVKGLDFTTNYNQIFLDVFIDLCERLRLTFYFKIFCRVKEKNNLELTIRNQASLLYLNGIRSINDFRNIQNKFLEKLQRGFESQEDNDKRVTFSLLNYCLTIVSSYKENNSLAAHSILLELIGKLSNFSFYNEEIVSQILTKEIGVNYDLEEKINASIDQLFNSVESIISIDLDEVLIESDTHYSVRIDLLMPCIYEIRGVSVQNLNQSDNAILGRGVSILEDEQQLFQYMYSYGKMHFKKCLYAYSKVENELDEYSTFNIIDWGCGQALASMSFMYFLQENNIECHVCEITLIEPSIIALKRGALHVRKFDNDVKLNTINKKLDELQTFELKSNDECVNIHLFSNILDIDDYSTDILVQNLNSYKGVNLIVIVSPYISDYKKNRIDFFEDKFRSNPTFKEIDFLDARKGEWPNYNCSIISRIFRVEL